jgi:hypothetical protein
VIVRTHGLVLNLQLRRMWRAQDERLGGLPHHFTFPVSAGDRSQAAAGQHHLWGAVVRQILKVVIAGWPGCPGDGES